MSAKRFSASGTPARRYVDSDHGLNSAVARLRESLNDSADEPRYVETVPRRGNRFIGELQVSPSSSRRGKELAYQQAMGKDNVWRIGVKNGHHVPGPATWTLLGNGIYLLNAKHESRATVEFFDFARRQVSQVWTLDKPGDAGWPCLQTSNPGYSFRASLKSRKSWW